MVKMPTYTYGKAPNSYEGKTFIDSGPLQHNSSNKNFCFVFEPHSGLRAYFLTPDGLEELYGAPRIKPKSATCKASILTTVLSFHFPKKD